MVQFSLFQILIFGAFCAISAAFLTAVAGAARRASLRYQLRVARQAARHANQMLDLLEAERATLRQL